MPIAVPALVDANLFDAVQAQLKENRERARAGREGVRYLLQGLVVCKQCGYVDLEPLEVTALERKMRPRQANEDHAALDPAAAHGSLMR
jgi:site-specific DNA recombinase